VADHAVTPTTAIPATPSSLTRTDIFYNIQLIVGTIGFLGVTILIFMFMSRVVGLLMILTLLQLIGNAGSRFRFSTN
jgi:hypothetical protein